MEKLTRSLSVTLDAIREYEYDESFMGRLYAGDSPIKGMHPKRLVGDISELRDLGYLKVFVYRGMADSFSLTALGRDYRRNRALDALRAVGRYAFQLLVGASGGAVALLLGRLLGQ